MSTFSEAEMVGICCLTECGLHAEEWPYIAQVIYNRVDAAGYPDTVEEVILQPKQFSAFNDLGGREADVVFDVVASRFSVPAFEVAKASAMWTNAVSVYAPLLPLTVLHFWSPQSMVPKWSAPKWAAGMKWIVPPGIDGRRFIFGDSAK